MRSDRVTKELVVVLDVVETQATKTWQLICLVVLVEEYDERNRFWRWGHNDQ
jgi:hypothetical protein